jgi:hypothetical protein
VSFPATAPRPRAARLDPADRLPDESTIENAANDLFATPDVWLDADHPMLGGKTPRACIGTGDEQLVWDLPRTIRHIGQT